MTTYNKGPSGGNSRTHEAALRYAQNHTPIFPVNGKVPLPGSHGYLDATTDKLQIERWFAEHPDANIAIPTGRLTKRVGIDIDPRHCGEETWAQLEAQHGKVATREARTGYDGRHLYFIYPEAFEIRNSAGKIGPGIDVRGEGGYIVVPPSVHPETGKPYVWVNNLEPAPLPSWLLKRLIEPPGGETKGANRQGGANGVGIPKGTRHVRLTSIAGSLRNQGLSEETILAVLRAVNAQSGDPQPDSDLQRIARDIGKKPTGVPNREYEFEGSEGFQLVPLSELLNQPDVPVDYVVENLLVAGTVACVVAKPRGGKSTFARNLCFRVARGEEFLGRKTKKGTCIYLALEERKEDVRNDFKRMGADGTESILVHAAAPPAEGIWALCDLVREHKPAVLVGDPMFRMINIKDGNNYAEVYQAMGPMIDVAREVGTLIVLPHHTGKREKSDVIDSPLGSTGISAAAACVVLIQRRSDASRTIETRPRIGQELPETLLNFDLATHLLSMGLERSVADIEQASEEILAVLGGAGSPQTEADMEKVIEGDWRIMRRALRQLVGSGKVNRTEKGTRGHPYKYYSRLLDSPICASSNRETENGSKNTDNAADILDSGFSQKENSPNRENIEKDGERKAKDLEVEDGGIGQTETDLCSEWARGGRDALGL